MSPQTPARHQPRSLAKTRPVSSPWSGPESHARPAPDPAEVPEDVGEPTPVGRPADADGAVLEAVAAAMDGLRVLEAHAHDVARAFRNERIPEGRDRLAELVETTQTMLRLAVATADVCGRDLEEVCRTEGLSLDVDTRQAVDLLIEHQLGEAWPRLATVLDEEFSRVLAQWRTVFERLVSGAGPEPGGRAA